MTETRNRTTATPDPDHGAVDTWDAPATRDYLRANLFDGDEAGRITVDLAGWLGELSDVVDDLIELRRRALIDRLRAVEAAVGDLRLIEPNEPDHPGPYYDGWHAALDAVGAALRSRP